ncbi:PAS/PAC sensor signal transduction histidine kinase [Niastella koreensis GR20-10]|uniref:histidine kinase n=2 Tax=Niastella koreensis TaxID=354356 RepID=G8TBU3_NIAKG|nr:PAS domain-containing sensor histidine kinase [Niastella koreensis]AEV98225.1 PAS/PAC sensor signal transduction histidine kinase [Niastella koreensis GR20-10]
MSDPQILSFESEAGFQALFQYATIGILVINREGYIQLANPCIEKMFGFKNEELISQPVELLIPEAMQKKHTKYRDKYFESPKARPMGYGLNLFAKKKNGSEFPVEISLGHYELYGEQLAVAFVTDISERVNAEDHIRQSEREYRLMFEGIHESFMLQEIVKDASGNIADLLFLEVNPATEKIMGKSRREIIGHLRSEFFGPLDKEVIGIIPRVEKGENVRYQQYFESIGRWFDRSFYSLKPGQLVTLSIDITQQKQAEKALRESQAALEKINASLERKVMERTHELTEALAREKELSELKSRFMSIASHEFRTPLTTILSSTSLIEQYTKEEQQESRKKHTERIKSSVKNLTDILSDFLSLDKLEQGKVQVVKEPLDLHELSASIIEELNGVLKKGQVILLFYEGRKKINQDKKILRNVLLNLLSNAIKYSEENKLISLSIEVENNQVLIKVKDEGIGIPEEEQKNLFGKFYRAKNATNIQGTGLGLNIVKRYIELLEGDITFVSRQNEGTVFTVCFRDNEAE